MNGCSFSQPKLGFQNKVNVHYKRGVEFNWILTKWSVKVESYRDDNYGRNSAFNKPCRKCIWLNPKSRLA